jgi:aminoglycoside phosphotransferase (APT) family kinase protein
MTEKRVRARRPPTDEPAIEPGDGWVEAGGELLLAVGETEGGFPFGVTVDEFREANVRSDRREGWARAKHALERVCSAKFRRQVDVGFVKFVGSGLSRDAFRACIDDGAQQRDVYALVPNRFAAADYARRAVVEMRLLSALGKRELGIRVAPVFGALRDSGGVILVEELVTGVPLDLRAGRQGTVRPWQVIAEVATEVHAVPVDELPEGLFDPRDCRSHGESCVARIKTQHQSLRTTREWLAAHLPPPEPGVLLHGDLLGQNVHLGFDEPHGVLDWEHAEVGDPASDLAIVTRGGRRPFQLPDGLERLLEAYAAAGGRPLTPRRVQFFELVILASQLERALDEGGDVAGAENRLRALLKRLA